MIPQLRSKQLHAWNFNAIAGIGEAHGSHSNFYFLALEEDKEEGIRVRA